MADGGKALAGTHLRIGWWTVLVFLTLGALLEAFHALKAPLYVDAENETRRLYGVLDRRLAGRDFVAGEDYSIADMAIYPWVLTLERNQKRLDDFPNLKRWFGAIAARPATIRAYRKGKAINQAPTITEESKKLLFGQGAVKRAA